MNDDNKRELDKVVELLLSPDMTNVQLAWSMINGKIWESMYEEKDTETEWDIVRLSQKDALGYIYAKFLKALITYPMIYGIAHGIEQYGTTGVWLSNVYHIEKWGKTTHLKGRKNSQIYNSIIRTRYAASRTDETFVCLEFHVYIWLEDGKYTVNLGINPDYVDETRVIWNELYMHIMGRKKQVSYYEELATERISKLFGSWTPK